MLSWLGGSARSLRGKRSPSGGRHRPSPTDRGGFKLGRAADVCKADALDGLDGWGRAWRGAAPAGDSPPVGLTTALAPPPAHAVSAASTRGDATVTVTVAPTPAPPPAAASVPLPPPSPAGRRGTKRVAWLPAGRNKDVARSLDLDAVA